LQFFQDGFIDVVEYVTVTGFVEVNFVDFVDHLPEQGSVFHVIVGILKYGAHDFSLVVLGYIHFFECRKEFVVDKKHQRFTRQSFRIGGPGLPF